jgi:cytochrome b subunit of formate dehydrogenase
MILLRRFRRPSLLIGMLAAVVGEPTVAFAQDDGCLVCHGDRSITMERRGRVVSLFVHGGAFAKSAHAALGCVSCHEDFDGTSIPHAASLTPVACTTCHSGEQFESFDLSVHGEKGSAGKSAATCVGCHNPHTAVSLAGAPVAEKQKFAVETCARCHAVVEQKFARSDHGLAIARGEEAAPSCIDCHGEHDIAAAHADSARTSHHNEAAMCMKCHLDDPAVRARMGPSAGFIAAYELSVHAKAVNGGNEGAASCSDCHGSHEMKKGSDPLSNVHRTNIASTCGRCHGTIEAQYKESIHGTALTKGIRETATCTDCHGEHNILSPDDPRSPVAALNISARVCTPCHGSLPLTQKYGLSSDRFRSFADSYHGLAASGGEVEVANCASCHGVHDIKPSSDPTSRIHVKNLAATCGECHPGANANFTKGAVHVIPTSGQDQLLYLVSTGYIVLIVLVIGGMVLHNVLDFVRKSKRQLMYRRGLLRRESHGHRLYLRMSLGERLQHGLLIASFTTLVLTGFMLRFPEAWWVVWLRGIIPSLFELRSLVHRVGGVVLVLAGLYHAYYLLFVPRGRQLFRDLLPDRKDLTDVANMVRYNLGLSEARPRFGRFSYIEKGEYWALVWGTAVMGITGVILWFENTFLGILTKLGWDVARTVHYYEAWLATLAIIVWHFYFVILNPDVYPINVAFWKGTLTEEEMADEHPVELEEILQREASESMGDGDEGGEVPGLAEKG